MMKFRNLAFVSVCFLGLLILTGCSQQVNGTSEKYCPQVSLSTPSGMIEKLQEIPIVENARRWENEYGQGIVISTRHYDIYTTMLEPLTLTRVPGYMESAHAAYQQQLPVTIETQNKFKIYLFNSRSQWEEFTKKFTGKDAHMYLKIKKGAYYLNGACVTYNIGRTRTFSVLGHEGWHQFNFRHFAYRLPSWLDEGLATHFETSVYEKGFFYFRPSFNTARLGSLRKSLKNNEIVPLGELLTLNPGSVVAKNDLSAVMTFYAQSYALVRFLKEDDYGRNLLKFQSLLLDARNGNWPLDKDLKSTALDRNIPMTAAWNSYVSPKLFNHYIGDHRKLQDRYLTFCRKIASSVRFVETTVGVTEE